MIDGESDFGIDLSRARTAQASGLCNPSVELKPEVVKSSPSEFGEWRLLPRIVVEVEGEFDDLSLPGSDANHLAVAIAHHPDRELRVRPLRKCGATRCCEARKERGPQFGPLVGRQCRRAGEPD